VPECEALSFVVCGLRNTSYIGGASGASRSKQEDAMNGKKIFGISVLMLGLAIAVPPA
jgi:hypothetical protein